MNYNDDNCRANLEMNDDSARPAISIDDLTSLCPDVTISDGRRFNAGATEDDVRQWMDGLDS